MDKLIVLRIERPQNDFYGGWIPMWTILTDFYDKNGYNRKESTFSPEGLADLGIDPDQCILKSIDEVKL